MISAVIITYNEERNIGRCLASLEGIADEVIVLDGHSTDRTVEICKEFGATVIDQEWLGYSATKNRGNELANHPYILSIDADEAIGPVLRQTLLSAKNEPVGAYSFNRLAYYCGKPIRFGGWYPDEKVRLFPKGQAFWVGSYVHERLRLAKGLAVHHLKGDLLHYTYYEVAEHHERARKYAALAADKLRKRSKFSLFVNAVTSPPWRFLQMFVFRLGFLDGWRGWAIATITAREVALKYWWALRGTPKEI